MADYYRLNEDHSVTRIDLFEWAHRMEGRGDPDRWRVDGTMLSNGKYVSTVFLGLNHAFGSGPPLLFETMVFPSDTDFADEYCERCSTWDEAVIMHAEAVALYDQ